MIYCFRPAHNTPGKKDVTGAFAPELTAFCRAWNDSTIETLVVDNRLPMAKQRASVLRAIRDAEVAAETVAFFCHGWKGGIQLGFTNAHVDKLASALADVWVENVVLYCCSTGGDVQTKKSSPGTGDGSFADRLRDALCQKGRTHCRVVAHTTVAHTTKNPYVRFFDGMGSKIGGAGGYFPVAPGSELWPKWRRALQSTDLRFRFPAMDVEDIHAELVRGMK
jgi:hypothetical protein